MAAFRATSRADAIEKARGLAQRTGEQCYAVTVDAGAARVWLACTDDYTKAPEFVGRSGCVESSWPIGSA